MFLFNRRERLADDLNKLAVDLQAQGRSRDALEAFQKAAAIFDELGDKVSYGRCLNGVGACFKDLADHENAKLYLERALLLRRETHDTRGEAITLTTLGPVYFSLGNESKAVEILNRAIQLTELIGDEERRGQAVFNLGEIAMYRGSGALAYELFNEALSVADRTLSRVEIGKCQNALARTALGLGLFDEAFEHASVGVSIAWQLGNSAMMSVALDTSAQILWKLGKRNDAINVLKRSIDLDLKLGSPAQAAYSMVHLAGLHYEMGQLSEARVQAEIAEKISNQTGDLILRADALEALGVIGYACGDFLMATKRFKDSLSLARRINSDSREAHVLYHLGLAYDEQGQREDALSAFARACSILDRSRDHTQQEHQKLAFFNQYEVQNTYCVYTARLIDRARITGKIESIADAFNVCERRHARALLDFLSKQTGINPNMGTLPSEILDFEASKEYMPENKLVSVEAVQNLLVDSHTALIEYSVQNQRSFAWVITANSYEVVELPGGVVLREMISRIRDATKKLDLDKFSQVAHELYQILVNPLEAWLLDITRLVIIPDDILNLLPFQMLITGVSADPSITQMREADQIQPEQKINSNLAPQVAVPSFQNLSYLIKKYTIGYAPSASVFSQLRYLKNTQHKLLRKHDFIGFAPVNVAFRLGAIILSALPSTATEVQSIASLFSTDHATVKLYDEASKTTLQSSILSDYRFVHFATHGYVDQIDPEKSALVLYGTNKEQCMLFPFEILNLTCNNKRCPILRR